MTYQSLNMLEIAKRSNTESNKTKHLKKQQANHWSDMNDKLTLKQIQWIDKCNMNGMASAQLSTNKGVPW